uniref:Uncharacterized protein n=1 Tax=Mesocestoides corti TaxID=53468 RepID=A0A5K3FYF0_MESCO
MQSQGPHELPLSKDTDNRCIHLQTKQLFKSTAAGEILTSFSLSVASENNPQHQMKHTTVITYAHGVRSQPDASPDIVIIICRVTLHST